MHNDIMDCIAIVSHHGQVMDSDDSELRQGLATNHLCISSCFCCLNILCQVEEETACSRNHKYELKLVLFLVY